MKITFPNKEQAREAFENAKRVATKYTWKKQDIKWQYQNKSYKI